MNKNSVIFFVLLFCAASGCARQDPALELDGGGGGNAPAEAAGYKWVEPIAVTYGLASRDSSGIYMNFTYRFEGKVRHGFLRSSETGMGRIFCPTMVQTAINLGERMEVAYQHGSNSGLYDDLVLGVRFQGRVCPSK